MINILYRVKYSIYIYILKNKNLVKILFVFSSMQLDSKLGCPNLIIVYQIQKNKNLYLAAQDTQLSITGCHDTSYDLVSL